MKKTVILFAALLLSACGYRLVPEGLLPRDGIFPGGMAWGLGSFDSNGERIYYTATNAEGERIASRGGSSGGMMMGGFVACSSCHGPDARGGTHVMHMDVMDAPDIRWKSLSEEAHELDEDGDAHSGGYDLDTFRSAVVEGKHPDGESLSADMPRWRMSDQDLADLAAYLQSLP